MNFERKHSFLILMATFLWALDLLVRYPITLKMGFVSIVFFESLIGLVFISPFLIKNISSLKKLDSHEWLQAAFIGGVGMSVAGYLQNASIQKATPGLFSFFQIFQPIFVISLAQTYLKERTNSMYVYWGMWVILSAILMFSVDLGLMLQSNFILNDILIALSTMIIWGLCTILAKKFLYRNSPLILVSLRWFFAFVFSLMLLLYEGRALEVDLLLFPEVLLRFLFMGVVAGLFSMYLYYSGLQKLAAGRVSFIEISYAAFGLTLSALYTFEALTFFQLLGSFSFFTFITLFISKESLDSSTI